jgi:hypothetical protein
MIKGADHSWYIHISHAMLTGGPGVGPFPATQQINLPTLPQTHSDPSSEVAWKGMVVVVAVNFHVLASHAGMVAGVE